MRHLRILLLIIVAALSACNNHSEEDLYTILKIDSELEPHSLTLDWGALTPEERHQYPRDGFLINSADDFPTDSRYDVADLKLMNIDYAKYSLLVNFCLIPGLIQGHNLYWYYDNSEKRFFFQANFNIIDNEDPGQNPDTFTYYRAAILVKKIPSDSKVEYTYSN